MSEIDTSAEAPYTGRALASSKTGVRGVSFNARIGKYKATIQVEGKRRHLGFFSTLEDAAEAYRRAWGGAREGKPIYRRRYVNGKEVAEHRLVWEAAHGPIPPGRYIDHIDGDKTNNDLSNLRLATPSQNQWNKGALRTNRTGAKGVSASPTPGRFYARIKVNYRQIHLGTFDSVEAAAAAYAAAAHHHHGEFARAALAGSARDDR